MSDTEDQEQALHAKQRKEKKELQAKIQSLKKGASKDKKKKLVDEIAKLEIDLEKKHSEELNNLNKNVTEKDQSEDVASIDVTQSNNQRVSKAQKRREKKAIEEKERLSEILAQEEINKSGPRNLELQAFKSLLKLRGLTIYPIASDGDCLYNAIRHQLQFTSRPIMEVKEMRELTANYICKNKTTLIAYMTNNETGDCLNDEEFEKYCNAIKLTPAWGGQIEIQALANVLKTPIEVLQATGPPTIQGENEFKSPNLVITYHRHMYSLGEHYNSTSALVDAEESEDEVI